MNLSGKLLARDISGAKVVYADMNISGKAIIRDVSGGKWEYGVLDVSGNIDSEDITDGAIVNADVNAAAGIAYPKLTLSGSVVNADINTAAAVVYSKLQLSGQVLARDISGSKVVYADQNISGQVLARDLKYTKLSGVYVTGLAITYTHNWGAVPTLVFITQISTAFQGALAFGEATASTIAISTNVSGSVANVVLLA